MLLRLVPILLIVIAIARIRTAREDGHRVGFFSILLLATGTGLALWLGVDRIREFLKDRRKDELNTACEIASDLPRLADRKAVLERSLVMTRDADFRASACDDLGDELKALETQDRCTLTVPVDRPCLCGTMRSPEDAPCDRNRCARDPSDPYSPSDKSSRILVCAPDAKPAPRSIQERFDQWERVTPCWPPGPDDPAPSFPCRIHADLDGDQQRDRIMLVEYRSADYTTRTELRRELAADPVGEGRSTEITTEVQVPNTGTLSRGLAVFFAGAADPILILPGRAGWLFKSQDLSKVTAWMPIERSKAPAGLIPQAARGDAFRLVGTGLLVYFDGKKLVAARDREQVERPAPPPHLIPLP